MPIRCSEASASPLQRIPTESPPAPPPLFATSVLTSPQADGSMRAVPGWLVLVLLGCSRTSLEFDASLTDGARDTGVGRGGSAPHGDDGGIGAASTGGFAGARGGAPNAGMAGTPGPSERPLRSGGPVSDCRADPLVLVPVKDRRWLALEASRSRTAPSTLSLIELTPVGPIP